MLILHEHAQLPSIICIILEGLDRIFLDRPPRYLSMRS
jgi:hypothetical protein